MSARRSAGSPAADGGAMYHDAAIRVLARAVSWEDREPFSPTYGCFDRTYWGWKFTDFPGGRFQEAVYALAYFFRREFPGNDFASSRRVLEWARAGMRFWQSIQYGDGSFDEAYPFERSLAAVAFTSFYAGEAFLLLGDDLPGEEQASLRRTFTRAGDWLCANDERHGVLSNHLAAAAAALHVIHRICGDDRYRERSRYFLGRIYRHQSSEGWYEEYGGADPGYQTHATFYLARIWQYTQDPDLLESLRRSIAFLTHFLHPNGTLGGEYGSRNTEFYFPAAFEMLSSVVRDAALIAGFMRPSVATQTAAGLATMDVYNLLPMLNNYLFSADHARDLEGPVGGLLCQEEKEAYFPHAGLFVKSSPVYYAVLGLSKGGVLKVYDRNEDRLLVSECGYWARVENGQIVSSQSFSTRERWSRLEQGFAIEADFVKVNHRTQSPWLFVGFRLFSLTAGRWPRAAYWLKDLLVRVLVHRRREVPLRLVRRVEFEPDRVFLSDELTLGGAMRVHTLRSGTKFGAIHMGSSRYFQGQELEVWPDDDSDWADELMRRKTVSVKRKLTVGGRVVAQTA